MKHCQISWEIILPDGTNEGIKTKKYLNPFEALIDMIALSSNEVNFTVNFIEE